MRMPNTIAAITDPLNVFMALSPLRDSFWSRQRCSTQGSGERCAWGDGDLAAPPDQIGDRQDRADEQVENDAPGDELVMLRKQRRSDRQGHPRMSRSRRQRQHRAIL